MELFLNVIWLAVVVAAAIAFARWSGRQTPARRRLGALATICVLALLFPIISATDDINEVVAAFEEITAVRRAVFGAMHTIHPAPAVVALAALILASVARSLLTVAVSVIEAGAGPLRPGFDSVSPLRGPPSSQR